MGTPEENENYVKAQYDKCMGIIEKMRGKSDEASLDKRLAAISIGSQLLYLWNQRYTDDSLEEAVEEIASQAPAAVPENYEADSDVVLFYDGFGLDTRGLALIYLKALVATGRRVVYLTDAHGKGRQPQIDKVLAGSPNAEKLYLPEGHRDFYTRRLQRIEEVVCEKRPAHALLYTTPDDSSGVAAFMRMKGKVRRYQINLTDHAFWLGRDAFDVCIEFRDYGAYISKTWRHIKESALVLLPFYPWVDSGVSFQGMPEGAEKYPKIVFSGGSLYKTFDADGTYYRMVGDILHANEDICFVYAGAGDSSGLERLAKEYPGRVLHIEERADLYRLMRHVTIYLSTYPMVGGLMTQYAIAAGKVPLTLRHDDDGDGIIIDQEKRRFTYGTAEALVEDATRLLQDAGYRAEREALLAGGVIGEDVFNWAVASLLDGKGTGFALRMKQVDTASFIADYQSRFDKKDFENSLANRRNLCLAAWYPGPYARKLVGGGAPGWWLDYESVGCPQADEGRYDVSVLVATYNPDAEALMRSIASVVLQRGVRIQLVLADDGSERLPLNEAVLTLERHGFRDWVACLARDNAGTVKNISCGVAMAAGRWVKSLGQGDCLNGFAELAQWVADAEASGAPLSMASAVYFRAESGHVVPVAGKRAQPQQHGEVKPWWHSYLFYDDLCVGAGTLVKREIALRYLALIDGKARFAEDNIYRIMAADHVPMCWYEGPGVLYEDGTGISTSGSDVWAERIERDWRATDRLIENRLSGRELRAFRVVRTLRGNGGLKAKLERFQAVPGLLSFKLRSKLHPRFAPDTCDEGYLELLEATAKNAR